MCRSGAPFATAAPKRCAAPPGVPRTTPPAKELPQAAEVANLHMQPASTTLTWWSARSSGACPSTATRSSRSGTRASPRSWASAARRLVPVGPGSRSGPARRSRSRHSDWPQATGTPVGLHHVGFEAGSRPLVDERATGSTRRARDRGAARGVRLPAGVLRGVLLRPGRDQARDRPRARVGRVGLLERDRRRRPFDLQLRDRPQTVGPARVERRNSGGAAALTYRGPPPLTRIVVAYHDPHMRMIGNGNPARIRPL